MAESTDRCKAAAAGSAVWPLRTAAGSLLVAALALSTMFLSDPERTRLALNVPPPPSPEERLDATLLAAAMPPPQPAITPAASTASGPIITLDPPPHSRQEVATAKRTAGYESSPDRIASSTLHGLRLNEGGTVKRPRVAPDDGASKPFDAPATPSTPSDPFAFDRPVPDPLDLATAASGLKSFKVSPPRLARAASPSRTETPTLPSSQSAASPLAIDPATGLLGGYYTREVVRRPAELPGRFALFGSLPLVGGIPIPTEEVIETRESFMLLSPERAAEILRQHADSVLP